MTTTAQRRRIDHRVDRQDVGATTYRDSLTKLIRQMRARGHTLGQIADLTGVKPGTVHYVLTREER